MIDADPKLLERRRNRANKIRGDQAEAIVAHRLRALGFQAIVKLETGWRVVRKAGKIIGAKPLAKVSGDFRAVAPGGRSILVEVKRRAEVLRQSDFQPHSRRALDDHAAAGGLSLIAWVSPPHGIAIFDWRKLRDHPKGPFRWEDVPIHYDLVAWAKARDPEGKMANIAELLNQSNESMADIEWKEPIPFKRPAP